MTLDEAREHVNESVTYQPVGGPSEDGVIAWVTGRFVFVRYGSELGAKATRPEHLVLRSGSPAVVIDGQRARDVNGR
jgi:hypothetical protein